jgi:hypothetical protein
MGGEGHYRSVKLLGCRGRRAPGLRSQGRWVRVLVSNLDPVKLWPVPQATHAHVVCGPDRASHPGSGKGRPGPKEDEANPKSAGRPTATARLIGEQPLDL